MRNKIILVITLVSLFTSSCKTSRISQTQMELIQYSLEKKDLPVSSSWKLEGKGWGADYGGESYGITYTRDQFVFINHIVSLHSNEERAKQAYSEWEAEWYSIADFQPNSSFSPLSLNNDYRYECEKKEPDDPIPYLRVCIFLQRHDRVINFVRILFDDRSTKNLTFDEVNNVLEILDERLNKSN